MSNERERPGLVVTGIHIDLKEGSITFDAEDEAGEKQTLAAAGIIFHQPLPRLDVVRQGGADASASSELAESGEPGDNEKERRVTLTGRLKTKPRAGRPDRRGNPTAYARFAAHEEGQVKPHDYIATFHRHTTAIAFSLGRNSQITVDGYPHESGSQNRLDTFSVINIVNYPGMPRKK